LGYFRREVRAGNGSIPCLSRQERRGSSFLAGSVDMS
jgi:hypothetical protein